jgi:hypothetical protein
MIHRDLLVLDLFGGIAHSLSLSSVDCRFDCRAMIHLVTINNLSCLLLLVAIATTKLRLLFLFVVTYYNNY